MITLQGDVRWGCKAYMSKPPQCLAMLCKKCIWKCHPCAGARLFFVSLADDLCRKDSSNKPLKASLPTQEPKDRTPKDEPLKTRLVKHES